MPLITLYPTKTTPSNSDLLVLHDVAAGNTKTITRGNLLSGTPLPANAVDTQAIATNAITAAKLATDAITLAYVPKTSNQAIGATSNVAITDLTATVTIPSGGRKVKITAYLPNLNSSAQSGQTLDIWDGTVGTGTSLTSMSRFQSNASTSIGMLAIAIVSPAAGSKTYNVGISNSAGTLTLSASAGNPSWLLVEVI